MRNPAVDRRLRAIVGLSLALHGGLFAVVSLQRQAPPAELPVLLASLRRLASTESGMPAASVPAAVFPQQARPLPPREVASLPRARAAAGPAIALPAATGPAVGAEGVAALPGAPSVVPASPSAAAAPPPPRPATDLLAAYRQRLTELFAGQQEYPRIAALRGWEGEVRLRLKVARKGNLLGVVLDRSSGFAVLDQHALAMLASLGGLPPLPEALDDNEIQVVIPINYKLNKTT